MWSSLAGGTAPGSRTGSRAPLNFRDPFYEAGRARLVVENGGQVLEQRQVDELSQPFRRLEADRIGTDNGSGLGLSIVAAIAEAHDGRLGLQARPGGGLRVCIDLPAAVPADSVTRAGAPA